MSTSYNYAYNASATSSSIGFNQPPADAVYRTQATLASNYAGQCSYNAGTGNLFISSGVDTMPWITVGAYRRAPPIYAMYERTWPRSMFAS